jgi:Uma2 family endonuclease
MNSATKLILTSVHDYLAAKSDSPPWYEYVNGLIFQRPDECNRHHLIAGNIFGAIAARLRRKGWHAWSSATVVRIECADEVRFYHPDVSVIADAHWHDEPTAIFEVLSENTYRVDMVEKKDAYLTIPSLQVYVLVEQETAAVIVFRRAGDDFIREVRHGLDAVLPLPEIEIELPLAEIYDGVEFTPEPDDSEA